MRKLIIAAISLLLASCYTPPEDYKVNNTIEVDKSQDVVWKKAVEYFAFNNIKIDTIDKNSGIIEGEKPADPDHADCGTANTTPVLEKEQEEHIEAPMMRFNVYVKSNNGKTEVAIHNAAGRTKAFQPMEGDVDVLCNSKGALEKDFFDYINK